MEIFVMSLWLDETFLKQIMYRMESWKAVAAHTYNGRCHLCGDSQKNKSKKRGYFYETDNGLGYKCFNCQATMPFGIFLRDFDPNLFKQYCLEKFKDSAGRIEKPRKVDVDEFIKTQERKIIDDKYKSFFTGLPTIRECGAGHIAFDTLTQRKIPDRFFDEFYYCDNFPEWTNSFTGKYSTLNAHDRIIIPFWDNYGRPTYFQGRSFGKVEPRYFTYKILEDSDYKCFGLDKVDKLKPIRVVEGPLDACCIDNAVAIASSALNKFHIPGCKHVYIFDCEPYNKEICKLIRETVKSGKDVVIWPDNMHKLGKDINDFVISGFDIETIISDNTYSGLEAMLRFNHWCKCL